MKDDHTTTTDPWWLIPGQRVVVPLGATVSEQNPPVASTATAVAPAPEHGDGLWWFTVDLPPGLGADTLAQLYRPADVIALWSGR